MRSLRLPAPVPRPARRHGGGAALSAPAPALAAADGVTRGTIYQDGPDNRYLLGGEWLFRRDDAGVGLRQAFQRQPGRDGWSALTVPNAWNVGDYSVASMTGTVAWYRKDFRLPDARARLDWLVRFESVNYRSRVWLNGVAIGRNTGAYLPFDLRLPRRALKRTGTNRLVIRVDNRRLRTDFPPSGLTGSGDPAGGWWNYGGLLREVYLQRVDRVDVTNVVVRPELPCATCAASVLARVVVRNYGDRTASVRVTGSFGGRAAEPRPPARRRAQLHELRDAPARAAAAAVVAGQPVPVRRCASRSATAAGACWATSSTAGSARSRSPAGSSCSTAAR